MNPTETDTGIAAGVIAGIVVASLVVALGLAVSVFFVQRYYALQIRIHEDMANYPSTYDAPSSGQGRRASSQYSGSDDSLSEISHNEKNSDLVSYHSDDEGPLGIGRYSSARGSFYSNALHGAHDNLACDLYEDLKDNSKCSIHSCGGSEQNVVYVSMVNVGKNSAKNEHPPNEIHVRNDRKISSSSSAKSEPCDCFKQQRLHSSASAHVLNEASHNGPKKDNEVTVTTIGIRDRTSSEITISTYRSQLLKEKLKEKMRVKSDDDMNVRNKVHVCNGLPSVHTNGLHNRDSVVSVSTLDFHDRSLSDVTISTLSQNSVYVGHNGQLPNGKGEYNMGYENDEDVRLSKITLSTVLSDRDSVFSDEDQDSVIERVPSSHDNKKGCHDNTKMGIKSHGNHSKKHKVNGINRNDSVEDKKGKGIAIARTGSIESRISACSSNHACGHGNQRNRNNTAISNGTGKHRARVSSVSSESSLSDCSECNCCPYCKDCTSIISEEDEDKFVSVVSTDK